MIPFCDPVGWVESFGPVLGPILAALSVVAYPVYLLYLSYLTASATGQLAGAVALGGLAVAAVAYAVAVAVLLLVVVAVGAVVIGCLIALLVVVLRGLHEPAPVDEPRVPRRLGRRTPMR